MRKKPPTFSFGHQNPLTLKDLVVRKISHPFGPVVALDAAAFGPRAACVELPMPLKCPQLLKLNPANAVIEKQEIEMPIMPQGEKALHRIVTVKVCCLREQRRCLRMSRPGLHP